MHTKFDRALGRCLLAIWKGVEIATGVGIFLFVCGSIFFGVIYLATMIVKAAWNG